MTVSLDQDLLNTLTPEELAEIDGADEAERASLLAVGAQKDVRHTAGEVEAVEPPVKGADAEEAEGEAGEVDAPAEPADAAAADAAPSAGATPAEAAPASPEAAAPAAESDDGPVPLDAGAPAVPVFYRYELPADFEQRLNETKVAQDALLDRFEAGEITREELRTEQARLDAQRRELDSMQNRADVARDMAEQAMQATRQSAIDALFAGAAKPEHGGIDYRTDQAKFRDLDMFVKALGQEAQAPDSPNHTKPLTWFLNEAHRRVLALHGMAAAPAPAPAPTAAAPAVDPKKAALAKRRPALPTESMDLSAVPGGGDPSDVGGEFADIMDLDGDAFEAAIERMAKTQPDRWARFQRQQQ